MRLRYAYFVRCTDVVKDANGEVVELICTYDPETRGGNNPPDGRKVKGTLHWVSAADSVEAEVRLIGPLFTRPDPDAGNFVESLNPDSLVVLPDARLEPAIVAGNDDTPMQFERQGYFRRDRSSTSGQAGVSAHHRPARYLRQGGAGAEAGRVRGSSPRRKAGVQTAYGHELGQLPLAFRACAGMTKVGGAATAAPSDNRSVSR